MVSGKSAKELPPGWKEHVKVTNGRKIKYYTHEETGLKLHSKKRVIHSANTQEVCQGTSQSACEKTQKSDPSKSETSPVVVEENVSCEWLPLGWIMESRTRKSGSNAGSPYKIYVEPSTGCRFYSRPQVKRYLESINRNDAPEKRKKEVGGDNCSKQDTLPDSESIEGKSHISGKEENDMSKLSLEIVPCVGDRTTVLDDFPPGWIKEIRDRKSDRKRKDPFYIDPVSGYEFRSKVDALRYLETGNIDRCAIKPKKSQLKFVEDSICAHQKTECSKVDVMVIDDHGVVSSSAAAVLHEQKQPEAERSKETESNFIPADTKATLVDVREDIRLCSEVIKCGRSGHSCETNIEGSELSVKINDNGAVNSTASAILHEQKHAEEFADTKTQVELKKSKKRKPLSIPARISKRLSGQEPEMLPNMGLSERTLRAAVKKSVQMEERRSSLEKSTAANELPHQVDTNQQGDVMVDLSFPCKLASTETEMQNNIENPSQDQAVQEQAVGQIQGKREEENLRSQDSHLWYPFGDSFSDPCYEFAFKTLTGEIPFEDTLAFQNILQHPIEASCTQEVASFGLPEIDTTSSFQNDVPYQLDSVQNNAPTDQLPTNSTIQPGNINLPGCSSFGCQQPSLEARSKDYETKVNS